MTEETKMIMEKLESIDGKVTSIDKRLSNVETKVIEMDERLVKLEKKVTEMDERLVKLEKKVAEMDKRLVKLEEKVTEMDERLVNVETKVIDIQDDVKSIQMTLESVVYRNINVIGEAHRDLGRKLDEALVIDNEKEMLTVRVNILECEMDKIKKKVDKIAS